MIRWLLLLSIMQLSALAWLGSRVLAMPPAQSSNRAPLDTPTCGQALPSPHLTTAALSRAIREALRDTAQPGVDADAEARRQATRRVAAPADLGTLREIEQTIDYHLSIGRIPPDEMERLQARIARLDPANRSRVLSELVGAMNDGRLQGSLY